MFQGDGIPLSDDSKTTHKMRRFCRRYTNRVVIPPMPTKAIVAQRGASVGGIGIRRKTTADGAVQATEV